MNNDEQVFDFMAAAEETGRQVELLVRQIPGNIKTALADEWHKSAWFSELPQIAQDTREAAREARDAAVTLKSTISSVSIGFLLLAILMSFVVWVVTYWQVSSLHEERDELKREIQLLREDDS